MSLGKCLSTGWDMTIYITEKVSNFVMYLKGIKVYNIKLKWQFTIPLIKYSIIVLLFSLAECFLHCNNQAQSKLKSNIFHKTVIIGK